MPRRSALLPFHALLAALLGGCATAYPPASPDLASYGRTALVVEFPAPKDAEKGTGQALALEDVRSAFARQAGVRIESDEATLKIVQALHLDDPALAITPELAGRIRAASGADELLRFRITDYGTTPKAWEKGLITFEVASTLGIGALLYVNAHTRILALPYVVEEGVEETAEATGEFWALNEVVSPVRMEGALYDLAAGKQVGEQTATGLSDLGLTRLVRKIPPQEREAQLSDATRHAAEKLVGTLLGK